jgi:hypothetical protein
LPSPTEAATLEDGTAYMFNAPPGPIVVTAAKSGVTFKAHTMKAWAGALTTTVITE